MAIPSLIELKKNLKRDSTALPAIRVALLGDSATQFLAMAIKGTGVNRGFNIELFEADYDQVEQQFLNPSSDLKSFKADYVIVFHSTHKLLAKYNKATTESKTSIAAERIQFIRQLCESYSSKIIYFNYPEIDDSIFGSYANKIENSFIYQTRKFNYELMNLAGLHSNFFVCDVAAIQNKYGRNMMFNPSIYVHSDMALSVEAVPLVAARCLDIISAAQGKFCKCVVIDLDNTIWGGLIGDDGIESIELGHGLGIGKTFSEFQQWIKKLKNRGILIAVCSKNDEKNAKEPFEKHPEMVLQLADIAVFIANWSNKVDNIKKIQAILKVDFSSMVFLDDNPFERNMVREHIEDIVVPELPDDPADFLEYLYSLNLFETTTYSSADEERTNQYQIEAKRETLQRSFINESVYLESLNMFSEVRPFNQFSIPRVAQLTLRSNQFNLRTIRYSEADIKKISIDTNFQTFTFTLADKFGDNGLVGVVILEKTNTESLFINTWLMSCRVLKRGMELFTLNTIANYARENGYKKIIGEYIPTMKNHLVKSHYHSLGFSPVHADSQNLFELDLNLFQNKKCFITDT